MDNLNFKRISLPFFLVLIALLILFYGCGKKDDTSKSQNSKENVQPTEKSANEQTSQSKSTSENLAQEDIMISLPTMQCGTCKKNIETAVKKLDGIESINVDKKEKIAHINYDKSKTDPAKIEYAITSAGYDANNKKADPEAYKQLDDCCKLPKDRKEK